MRRFVTKPWKQASDSAWACTMDEQYWTCTLTVPGTDGTVPYYERVLEMGGTGLSQYWVWTGYVLRKVLGVDIGKYWAGGDCLDTAILSIETRYTMSRVHTLFFASSHRPPTLIHTHYHQPTRQPLPGSQIDTLSTDTGHRMLPAPPLSSSFPSSPQ